MRFPGFIGPTYQLQSINVDNQRCINLYPEMDELNTGKEREVASLVGTPGLLLLQTIGSGPIRGEFTASNDTLYVVSGNTLYSVSSAWAATSLGTLNTSSGTVSMYDNGIQLVIVDGTYGYYVTLTSGAFAQITDANFPGASQVTYEDGTFIFIQGGNNQFFISNLESVTFDASQVASKEANPDNIVSIICNQRYIWLLGETSSEVWYDAGASPFPFQRVEGTYLEVGCAAQFSVVHLNQTILWLGSDSRGGSVVYMANGFSPQRVSNHCVEEAIQSYGVVSDAVAYGYQQNGHFFYVLNFTSANTTWVYDMTTGLWHERGYLSNGQLNRHLGQFHAYAYGTHVVGDYQSGNIYALSTTTYTDNGNPIQRKRRSPHLTDDLNRIFHSEFQLDVESGVGLDGSGQGTNPQAMLRFSDDGGHTWSNEKWAGLGLIGQTKYRAKWQRLGSARQRTYEISITDPVKVTIIGARIQVQGGSN